MKIVNDVIDSALNVVEKANKGSDYEDIKQEAEKKKGFLSTVLTVFLIFFVGSIILNVIQAVNLSNRPSASENQRLREENTFLRNQSEERANFIQSMVDRSEEEKQRSKTAVKIAQEAKESANETVEKVEQINPVVETYNQTYHNQIKPNAK